MSLVRYKFRSELSYDSLLFDGMFISVGDLKRQIAEKRGMIATELAIHKPDTGECYADDTQLLARNTQVTVKRLHLGPQTKKVIVENKEANRLAQAAKLNAHSSGHKASSTFQHIQGKAGEAGQDEASALSNFVDASFSNWTSEVNAGPGGRGGPRRKFHSDIPPPSYVCHRCGVGGHWIYNCPTNGNAEYDIKKVKAPVGIPLERLVSTGEGTIVMPDGTIGDVMADDRDLSKLQETAAVARLKPAVVKEIPIPEEMRCPICSKLINDAVLILCCQTSYCDNCIRNELIETGICPKCKKEDMLCDDLVPNPTLRKEIQNHTRAQVTPQANPLSIEKSEAGPANVDGAVEPAATTTSGVLTPSAAVSQPSVTQPSQGIESLIVPSPEAMIPVAAEAPQAPQAHQGVSFYNPIGILGVSPTKVEAARPPQPLPSVISQEKPRAKPRFKVNAFKIPPKQTFGNNDRRTETLSTPSVEVVDKKKEIVELLRSVNRLIPNGPMSFMEEAFCMSATPLSRGDFQYLQDDFRPKKRSPSKYEPKNREKDVQDSYHKKRKGGHNRQHRDHSPPHRGASGGESRKVAKRQGNFDISMSPMKRGRKMEPPPRGGAGGRPDDRPLKRGGKRIVYERR